MINDTNTMVNAAERRRAVKRLIPTSLEEGWFVVPGPGGASRCEHRVGNPVARRQTAAIHPKLV